MVPRGVLIVLFASAPLALAAVPEPEGYRMDHYRGPVPDTVQGATVVHTAALPALIAQRHPVLIDVLPAPEPPGDSRPGLPRMPLPHKDIPGSIWLADVGRGAREFLGFPGPIDRFDLLGPHQQQVILTAQRNI